MNEMIMKEVAQKAEAYINSEDCYIDNRMSIEDVIREVSYGFFAGYKSAFDWVDINDRSNPIPNEGEVLIKLQDGSIRRYDEKWTEEFGLDGIVTHWRLIELP